MSESKRDPLQKYLVVDGPIKGRMFDHPDDHFYMAQVKIPGDRTEAVQSIPRVCYHLRERDGELVWSCEAPE
ncbi:hypothetical protein ACIPZ5_00330 [Pseudomonas sp. NPDC089428]|uniref:hypothetical protein n=1 Tax=Pseudomonas sp. NPDC089428 TaxID=3364467 RepID=UPI0037FAD8E8